MVRIMDGLNSMPWASLGRLANGWCVEVASIPPRDKFKYGYDLWSNGLAFEAFGIGRTYKASVRAPGFGDGMWLFNFDTRGRLVNASYTGTRWGHFEIPAPEYQLNFRLLPYPHYRPEMHRLIGGTWIRAKWTDQIDRSRLTYRAEIVSERDPFYRAAMSTLDEFVRLFLDGRVTQPAPEAADLVETMRRLPLKNADELRAEAARLHDILQIRGQIPVEAPELAFDHYHAIPVKVQDGCGGPCTFCTLYDRRIRITPLEEVFRQIDAMAGYLGEEVDHYSKVVLLEGDALAVPSGRLAKELDRARARFEFDAAPFAHAFCRAKTALAKSPDELAALRRAGLLNVNLGLESGCQELLDLVKRGQKLEEFREAVVTLREAGIEVSVNVIAGLGGVRYRDRHVGETIDFVRTLPNDISVFYSALHVFPESYYARRQEEKFDGPLSEDDLFLQSEVFANELGASEYLFVPM